MNINIKATIHIEDQQSKTILQKIDELRQLYADLLLQQQGVRALKTSTDDLAEAQRADAATRNADT